MSLPLSGRTALVTGGARRIGAGITRALVGAGARVAIGFRESGAAAAALVSELGESCAQSFQMELGDRASLDAAIADVVASFGGLDLLVNNAATFPSRPVAEIDAEHWQGVLETNLSGPLWTCLAALPHLRRSRGSIVNICDVYSDRPLAGHTAYCVSKAGLVMLTRCLALELAPLVRVNGVSPGAILFPEGSTDAANTSVLARTPLGRRGDPTDIAEAVIYLATAPFVSGQVIAVDGGRSLT